MLNRSASLAMSTCVLKALPGKLDIKRHSPSILYVHFNAIADVFKHLQEARKFKTNRKDPALNVSYTM